MITGISMRNGNSTANTTFPPADATWANYDITIGAAILLATWTNVFMNNFSGTPTTARGGPMVVETGSFNYNGSITTPQAQAWGEWVWISP